MKSIRRIVATAVLICLPLAALAGKNEQDDDDKSKMQAKTLASDRR